jgi:hypothetical protein
MLFSYGNGKEQNNDNKNAGKWLSISIAVQMRRYNTGHIARWSTSWALLGATGCHQWASLCIVWLTNSLKQRKTLTKHNF